MSDSIGLLVAATALAAAVARYGAVLSGTLSHEIERPTAIGFFIGFGLGAMLLALGGGGT